MELIDTHIHLSADDFKEDLDEVIKRAQHAGVTTLISIGAGYGFKSAELTVEIAERYSSVKATVGIHPHDAKLDILHLDRIRELAVEDEVVAIGETGLDFFKEFSPRREQEIWFVAQIELAKEVKKPLVIHSRGAGAECYRILKERHAEDVGGVFHCYSEDSEFADKLRGINFLVSFPGNITFKKADSIKKAVKEIPLDMIMLETDAPFLAPVPYRGKRCESSLMVHTAIALAELKGIKLEEVAEATTLNAKKLFKLI